jgi:hypothetical protein
MLLSFRVRFRGDSLQVGIESIETLFPEPAILFGPVGHVLEGVGVQLARTPLGLAGLGDETGFLENLEVLCDRRQAFRKGLARSETLAWPFERRASIARLVGSASAANVRLSVSCIILHPSVN